jgi:hypothetical protein
MTTVLQRIAQQHPGQTAIPTKHAYGDPWRAAVGYVDTGNDAAGPT